jgi:hypothetical protein
MLEACADEYTRKLWTAAEAFRDAADELDVVDTARVINVFSANDIQMGFVVDLVEAGVIARTKGEMRIHRERLEVFIALAKCAE